LREAAAQFPRDRVVLGQLGRILFLKRRFADAVSVFRTVLQIDAEDLNAHYNLMLCHQGLGDRAQAEREQRLYTRFKADEASQAITGAYRLLHPEDNNERQAIHEHVSAPLRARAYSPRARAEERAPAAAGERAAALLAPRGGRPR
jgi:tetratricopeptide (TPR) repeat protein